MTQEQRREAILTAARTCFAKQGFAATTTKSLAQAASISEGLLFKHFPSKAALYSEILDEECRSAPALQHLVNLPPSADALFQMVTQIVRHHQELLGDPASENAERFRLTIISLLDGSEFTRLIDEKISRVFGKAFSDALLAARACGDAYRSDTDPMEIFWFAQNSISMRTLRLLHEETGMDYQNMVLWDRYQVEFILRGIGLKDSVIASLMGERDTAKALLPATTESA